MQATPTQLVFGRDAILNTKFEANWRLIKERKQKRIQTNNEQENSKRKPYTYVVGDKVLIKEESNTKYGNNPYDGPYEITAINANGVP